MISSTLFSSHFRLNDCNLFNYVTKCRYFYGRYNDVRNYRHCKFKFDSIKLLSHTFCHEQSSTIDCEMNLYLSACNIINTIIVCSSKYRLQQLHYHQLLAHLGSWYLNHITHESLRTLKKLRGLEAL